MRSSTCRRFILFCLSLLAAVAFQSQLLGTPLGGAIAFAQSTPPTEKDAFETAKELGTAEAWNAFLSSYPSGFYADMARAYLKKDAGTDGSAPDAPTLVPSSQRAAERPCADQRSLRSEKSTEPTKITFVNASGMYRAIMWIDFEGNLKDYGGLNPGAKATFDTYRSHPWMIATGPGDCLQIFLPAAEPSTVELMRMAADDGPIDRPAAVKSQKEQDRPQKRERAEAKKPLVCGKNYALKNGECVLLQNCGKHAYRSPEGDCYCKKGYKMQNGKCVWPTDKQGFEVAPWKKSGCKTWQAQCNQGNGKACGEYEANCQVN